MTFHPRRRDPDAPHQVVVFTRQRSLKIHVSCNCRREPALTETYDPIGVAADYPETARLYNDPAAHRKEFGPRDRIRIG